MTTQTPPMTYLTEDDHQRLYDILAEFEDKRKRIPDDLWPAVRALRLFVEDTYRDDNCPVVVGLVTR